MKKTILIALLTTGLWACGEDNKTSEPKVDCHRGILKDPKTHRILKNADGTPKFGMVCEEIKGCDGTVELALVEECSALDALAGNCK